MLVAKETILPIYRTGQRKWEILHFPRTIDMIDLNYLNVLRLFFRQNLNQMLIFPRNDSILRFKVTFPCSVMK